MDHHRLCSVLSRRPALRPLLDFHPFCRWCCSRIHNRTAVCSTPRPTHRPPYPDPAFDSRLGGMAYTDVLHVFGMSRAGYILQMLNLGLSNSIVIFELLQKTGARALVCEPSSCVDLSGCPVPNYSAIQVREQDAPDVALPPLRTEYPASDLVFIFHTSGSTGGSPKLIPCNRRWLDNVIAKCKQLTQGRDVVVVMYGNLQSCPALFFDLKLFLPSIHSGSMCHIPQISSKRPTLAAFFSKCVNRCLLV